MSDFLLSRINLRKEQKTDTVAEYRRQEKALEETCKQFEGIFLATMWKDMMKSAKSFGGEEEKNAFAPMEDLAMEMVSEHLSESQGVGMWKVLYDQLHLQIPVPDELKKQGDKR
ncbi:MAG: hypothetical protein KBH12_09635 [Synergistaceae bacterium]|nr:hypothetical protein [Synergistaceae bacterium]